MRCRTASPRSCSRTGRGRRRDASWSSPGGGRCRSTPTHGHRPGHDDNDDDDNDDEDNDDEDLVLQPNPPVGQRGVPEGEGGLCLLNDGDGQRLVLRTHDLHQPTLRPEQIPRIRRYVYIVDI